MTLTAEAKSTANELEIRTAVELALKNRGGTTVENANGVLLMDLGGSVGKAFLAGGFRDKMKMPMRLTVRTTPDAAGTQVSLEVGSRGTGGGFGSGGIMGMSKQRKAEAIWLDAAIEAVPARSTSTEPRHTEPPRG